MRFVCVLSGGATQQLPTSGPLRRVVSFSESERFSAVFSWVRAQKNALRLFRRGQWPERPHVSNRLEAPRTRPSAGNHANLDGARSLCLGRSGGCSDKGKPRSSSLFLSPVALTHPEFRNRAPSHQSDGGLPYSITTSHTKVTPSHEALQLGCNKCFFSFTFFFHVRYISMRPHQGRLHFGELCGTMNFRLQTKKKKRKTSKQVNSAGMSRGERVFLTQKKEEKLQFLPRRLVFDFSACSPPGVPTARPAAPHTSGARALAYKGLVSLVQCSSCVETFRLSFTHCRSQRKPILLREVLQSRKVG